MDPTKRSKTTKRKEEEKKGNDNFLIIKSTMITKNEMPINQVYKIDKKTLGSGTFGVVNKV